jgi:hypothetical protein
MGCAMGSESMLFVPGLTEKYVESYIWVLMCRMIDSPLIDPLREPLVEPSGPFGLVRDPLREPLNRHRISMTNDELHWV